MFGNLRKLLPVCLILVLAGVLAAADVIPVMVSNDNKLDDRDILAEYDGGKILRQDIDKKISKLPAQYQGRYRTVEGQLQVLDITATEEAFYQKAKQMGLDKAPDVLEKISQMEKRYYLQEYYKRNVTDLVLITEQDKLDYYNQNLRQYYMYPNISIDLIQAKDQAEALKALDDLNGGTPFDVVSDTYNQNTYAKGLKGRIKNIRLNGNIPGVGNDLMLEDRIEATQMDLQTYHGPFETETGWYIFRTIEWITGRQKEFLEVQPEIEQRLRPIKERELLDSLRSRLMTKYAVVVDTALVAQVDLKARKNNANIEAGILTQSPEPSLQISVARLLDIFDKMSPQEQIFYVKGEGAKQLIDQELIQTLLFLEGKATKMEQYFQDNEEYVQARRSVILRRVFEILVLDKINITPEDITARYEADIETYALPGHRTIQALFFKDLKSANRTWRKFNTAHKRGNEKTMTKLVTKNSIKKEQSIFPNQYQNGVITGIGPDEDFSKRIWDNPVGYLSPVFTAANGDIVFFRTLSESPKTYKPQVEVEPRIIGLLKTEREKSQQEAVTEQLYVEFNMKKYPERVRLQLSATELFDYADNAARNRNFKDAVMFYDQIVQTFKNGVDDYKAFFMKAFLMAEEMKNTELALQLFREFITRFPVGELHESAQFMIDSLEGNIDIFEDLDR